MSDGPELEEFVDERAQMGPTPHVPVVTLMVLLIGLLTLAEIFPDRTAALLAYVESVTIGITFALGIVAVVGFVLLHATRYRGGDSE